MASLRRLTLAVIVIGLILSPGVSPPQAQAVHDPGLTEPYHIALVHYRVGIYFLLRLEPARAMVEFDESIEHLPTFGYFYIAHAVGCLLNGQPTSGWSYLQTGNRLLDEYSLPYHGVGFLRLVELIFDYQLA